MDQGELQRAATMDSVTQGIAPSATVPNIKPDPAASDVQMLSAKDLKQAEITAAEVEGYKEQDHYLSLCFVTRLLPIANVGRIMKKCLPPPTKVSKEAKECVQECTSEFISFIASEAAERCLVEKRKTITGDDLLFAMTTLGFEMYADVLKIYLAKYRNLQRATGKRSATPWKRQKRTHEEGGAGAQEEGFGEEFLNEEDEEDDEEEDDEEAE